jgi:hypothetical protein
MLRSTSVKETVVRTSLADLHAVEDASGLLLVMWMLAGIFAANVTEPGELFKIMAEGTQR